MNTSEVNLTVRSEPKLGKLLESFRLGGAGGGGGGEGGGGVTSYICIVRMCVPNSPLFQRCQVYDWPPFFNKKYMNGQIFLDSCVKGPIFLTSWYMHIFFAQRFFEAAYPLVIT